jgi:hypothetical protein
VSVPVDVTDLAEHVRDRGPRAYVLTTSDDARPHSVSVALSFTDGVFACDAGNRTVHNASERPLVSLLWPGAVDDDYSLIVDGDAHVEGERRVVITPTRAVLHRLADCVPLDVPARR